MPGSLRTPSCAMPDLWLPTAQPSTCSRAQWFPSDGSRELTWPRAAPAGRASALAPATPWGGSSWVLVSPHSAWDVGTRDVLRHHPSHGRLCQPCAPGHGHACGLPPLPEEQAASPFGGWGCSASPGITSRLHGSIPPPCSARGVARGAWVPHAPAVLPSPSQSLAPWGEGRPVPQYPSPEGLALSRR